MKKRFTEEQILEFLRKAEATSFRATSPAQIENGRPPLPTTGLTMGFPRKLTQALGERRSLRKRSTLHIAVADKISHLNAESWRAITAGQSFFHSYEYLKGLETFGPENIEPRYALISDDDEPLAAVYMQIVSLDLHALGAAEHDGKLKGLRSRVRQRLLVCGNLIVYGLHGVCFAPGSDRSRVWPAVAEVLYRVRRAEKLAGHTGVVLIKDLDEDARMESNVVEKLSYGLVATEQNMVLMLSERWQSHDDYLQSLTSKFRSDIKNRIYKKCSDAGCLIDRLVDVAPHADELQSLYMQVHAHAKMRPFMLSAAYWKGLADVGRENLAIHVARQNGRIIGFIATLRDGDTSFAYHIGFDRAVAETGIPIYLRLLHASLDQAIAFGSRRVSFGRTALEPKARMGCIPEPTYIWARHRHPMFNQLIQPLLKLIHPQEPPQYSPFKETARPADAPVGAN